jgi:hypothetical protein
MQRIVVVAGRPQQHEARRTLSGERVINSAKRPAGQRCEGLRALMWMPMVG